MMPTHTISRRGKRVPRRTEWDRRETMARWEGAASDGHTILLVPTELVHLYPYLLDEGLYLLTIDVDGYPAGV